MIEVLRNGMFGRPSSILTLADDAEMAKLAIFICFATEAVPSGAGSWGGLICFGSCHAKTAIIIPSIVNPRLSLASKPKVL